MKLVNERGESPGKGPPWACAMYGLSEHDYNECRQCNERYRRHLEAIRGKGKGNDRAE